MTTLPFFRKNRLTQFVIYSLAYSFIIHNAIAATSPIDITDRIKANQSSVILEKDHLSNANASEILTIPNATNASFIVEGPNPSRINVSPTGISTEPLEKNYSSTANTNSSQSSIRIMAENVIFNPKKDTEANDDTATSIEHVQLEGYSRIIIRAFPQRMEIEFVDERLAPIVSQNQQEDDPDFTPAIMAAYLDTIVMNPVREITNTEDLVDNIAAETINEDIRDVRDALRSLLTPEALAAALNLTHPAKFADIDPIIFNNHALLYSNICRHFDELSCCINNTCTEFNIWGKAFGNYQNRGTDGPMTGYNAITGGMFLSLDYAPTDPLCLGAGLAFTYDNIKWKEEESNALNHTYYGFLYSSIHSQSCFLQAIVSLSYSQIDGNRFITLSPSLQRKANHQNHAWAYGGRLNAGFNVYLPCQVILKTYDSFDLGNVDTAAFTEGGAIALNLQVNKRSSLHLRNELGIQLSRSYVTSLCHTTCWTPTIGLAWVYYNPLSGNSMTANLQNQSSQFTIKTRDDVTNQISPQLSLTINTITGIYLSAYYEGAFGNNWNSNEFSLHMGKNF